MSPFIIGIAGGSGSGKSTIVDRLMSGPFGSHLRVLPHDSYYLNADNFPEAIRHTKNWDHPDALDNGGYIQHLEALKHKQTIERPIYDFEKYCRTTQTLRIEPGPVIIADGILLLAVPEIRSRLDLRVFVDTPADLRLLRRLKRDIQERGRSVQSVAEQYATTVRPMHAEFVEPSRHHADLVIPWELRNERAIQVLLAVIAHKIAENSVV